MIKEDLFDLYKKLYFHEIEMREKVNARLPIPLAILVAQVSFLGYMLQNVTTGLSNWIEILFWGLYVISALATASAIFYFIKSWYGYTYSFLPKAQGTEEYYKELQKFYEPYRNSEEFIRKAMNVYLYNCFIECSTGNTQINDKRSSNLHKTMICIIGAVLFSFFSFLPYHFGEMDKSYKASPCEVVITNPVQITQVNPSPLAIKSEVSKINIPPQPIKQRRER